MERTFIVERAVFDIWSGFSFQELFRGDEPPTEPVQGISFRPCVPEPGVYTSEGRKISEKEVTGFQGLQDEVDHDSEALTPGAVNCNYDLFDNGTEEEIQAEIDKFQALLDSFYTVTHSEHRIVVPIGYLEGIKSTYGR